MIMYEASEAIDAAVPANATMKVIHFGEAPAMVPRSIAGMSPDCSATATPMSTMRTSPRGGKVTKLFVAPATISRRDSVEKRFVTVTVSSVAGLAALRPIAEKIAERIMTITASERNSQNGCGSLLPTFSMTISSRINQLSSLDRFSCVSSVKTSLRDIDAPWWFGVEDRNETGELTDRGDRTRPCCDWDHYGQTKCCEQLGLRLGSLRSWK